MKKILTVLAAVSTPPKLDNAVSMPLKSHGCLTVMPMEDDEEAAAWDRVVLARAA